MHDVTKEEHIGQLASIYTGWSRFLDLPSSRYLIVGRKWGDERTVNKKPKTGQLLRNVPLLTFFSPNTACPCNTNKENRSFYELGLRRKKSLDH